MRLGVRTKAVIDGVVHDALAGERSIVIPVDNEHLARRMFRAVSERVEQLGGRADRARYMWSFSNGSEIRFGTAAAAE